MRTPHPAVPSSPFAVRAPLDGLEQLDAEAARRGVTRSQLVRAILSTVAPGMLPPDGRSLS